MSDSNKFYKLIGSTTASIREKKYFELRELEMDVVVAEDLLEAITNGEGPAFEMGEKRIKELKKKIFYKFKDLSP